MSERSAIEKRPAEPRKRLAPPSAVAAPPAVRVEKPGDDDERKFTIIGDPLWGMAIASIVLLAVLAALMASR